MALTVLAVEAFTQGRLDRDDAETQRQLDAALAAARTYCGWHVTPVLTNSQITVDGPGGRVLALPTVKITALSAITEDGVTLDLADVQWSERGLIAKNDGAFWSRNYRSITVTFSHGYAEAADFESAVLSSIERGAFSAEHGPRVIGPFQYAEPTSAGAAFSGLERATLDRYSLEKPA